jgi:hypothetical protein
MTVQRALDFVVYTVIGAVMVLAIFWLAEHDIGGGDGIVRWGGLGLTTAIIFIHFAWSYRRHAKHWSAWAVILGLLSARVLIFVAVQAAVSDWRAFYWGLLLPVDFVACDLILRATGHGIAGSVRR